MELVDLHENVSVNVFPDRSFAAGLVGNQRLEHRTNLIEIISFQYYVHSYQLNTQLKINIKSTDEVHFKEKSSMSSYAKQQYRVKETFLKMTYLTELTLYTEKKYTKHDTKIATNRSVTLN